ncbi:MAG: hypothetical protein AAF702_14890, partial [Chloroflexota bacterium]
MSPLLNRVLRATARLLLALSLLLQTFVPPAQARVPEEVPARDVLETGVSEEEASPALATLLNETPRD